MGSWTQWKHQYQSYHKYFLHPNQSLKKVQIFSLMRTLLLSLESLETVTLTAFSTSIGSHVDIFNGKGRPAVWNPILTLSDKWLSLDIYPMNEQIIIAQMSFFHLGRVNMWFRQVLMPCYSSMGWVLLQFHCDLSIGMAFPTPFFFSGILAAFICYLFYVMEYDILQRNHGLKSIATSGDLGPFY